MKLKLILTTAVVGIALALPSASSAAPPPPPPTQDSVVLTGGPALVEDPNALPLFSIDAINATSGPSGENPTGRVKFFVFFGPGFVLDGPVTCLGVQGNTATINFENQMINFEDPRDLVGTIITIRVVDDQPDTFGAAPIGRAPTDCSPALFGAGSEGPLSTGDNRAQSL